MEARTVIEFVVRNSDGQVCIDRWVRAAATANLNENGGIICGLRIRELEANPVNISVILERIRNETRVNTGLVRPAQIGQIGVFTEPAGMVAQHDQRIAEVIILIGSAIPQENALAIVIAKIVYGVGNQLVLGSSVLRPQAILIHDVIVKIAETVSERITTCDW